jgi:hypothetical protein
MESGRIALKTLGRASAGVIAIEAAAGTIIGQGWLAPLAGTACARLLDIVWMALLISRLPQGWSRLGLDRRSWMAGLLKGWVWSAGFGLAAILGWGLLNALGFDAMGFLKSSPAGRPGNLAFLLLVGGLIGPVAEEIYFRGLIYGYCRHWGFWPALGLSTLAFTLPHSGASTLLVTQIVGGLVFAAAYEVEKKLLVPITIHVLGNLALFSLAYV